MNAVDYLEKEVILKIDRPLVQDIHNMVLSIC